MEFIDNTLIEDFSTEGAVLCKGIFLDWLDPLRIGVDKLIQNPSVRERSYTPKDGTASFFQDLVNWDRIPEFKDNFDSIIGILYIKDLLPFLEKESFNWSKLIRTPFFVPEGYTETFAEMAHSDKIFIDHRSIALKKLIKLHLSDS